MLVSVPSSSGRPFPQEDLSMIDVKTIRICPLIVGASFPSQYAARTIVLVSVSVPSSSGRPFPHPCAVPKLTLLKSICPLIVGASFPSYTHAFFEILDFRYLSPHRRGVLSLQETTTMKNVFSRICPLIVGASFPSGGSIEN